MADATVLGVRVDAVSYDDVVERVIDAAHAQRGLAVSATAVHGLMEAVHDDAHRARLAAFDVITPDGQPVRWALNWLHGAGLVDRVYGPRLMHLTCARAAREQLPIFLYGSTPGVLAPLVDNLVAAHPGLVIAGSAPSRFGELDADAQADVAEQVRVSGARIVFVGLGCPRQEVFTWAMRDQVGLPLLAVGAAFDFHAGLASEAPEWMQRRGLQWLHRLAGNPRRLWRRYLLLNPEYLARLLAQRLGLWRPSPAVPALPTGQAIPG